MVAEEGREYHLSPGSPTAAWYGDVPLHRAVIHADLVEHGHPRVVDGQLLALEDSQQPARDSS